MLDLSGVDVFYDKAQALADISLHIDEGEIVSLMGRNGAGKSTLLKSIVGLLPVRNGQKLFRGEDITDLPPYKVSRLGIAYVPEDRQTFPNLSVIENMQIAQIAAHARKKTWSTEDMFQLFPSLQRRRHNRAINLSGGEQQMLAIARALMMSPELVLLDEPTEGLSPLLVNELKQVLLELGKSGLTIFIVEQNVRVVLDIAFRHYLIDKGCIEFQGTTEQLQAEPDVLKKCLGV